MYVSFFFTTFVQNVSCCNNCLQAIIKMSWEKYIGLHIKGSLKLSESSANWSGQTDFYKIFCVFFILYYGNSYSVNCFCDTFVFRPPWWNWRHVIFFLGLQPLQHSSSECIVCIWNQCSLLLFVFEIT